MLCLCLRVVVVAATVGDTRAALHRLSLFGKCRDLARNHWVTGFSIPDDLEKNIMIKATVQYEVWSRGYSSVVGLALAVRLTCTLAS